jgi:hypothetical protein
MDCEMRPGKACKWTPLADGNCLYAPACANIIGDRAGSNRAIIKIRQD